MTFTLAPAEGSEQHMALGVMSGVFRGRKVVALLISCDLFIRRFSLSSGLFRCLQSCQLYSCQPLQINSLAPHVFEVGNQRMKCPWIVFF